MLVNQSLALEESIGFPALLPHRLPLQQQHTSESVVLKHSLCVHIKNPVEIKVSNCGLGNVEKYGCISFRSGIGRYLRW